LDMRKNFKKIVVFLQLGFLEGNGVAFPPLFVFVVYNFNLRVQIFL
jgi:hypothetical protein